MSRLAVAQTASHSMGTRIVSGGVKKPGCEVNHSLPSSPEVKDEWSHTSTNPYIYMAWTGKSLPLLLLSLMGFKVQLHHPYNFNVSLLHTGLKCCIYSIRWQRQKFKFTHLDERFKFCFNKNKKNNSMFT
jgi:hypothetical protein